MNFSRAASKLMGLGRLFILQVSLTVAIVQEKSVFSNSCGHTRHPTNALLAPTLRIALRAGSGCDAICGMPARADITGVRLVYETEE
mgnify:FL=1